ARSVANHPAAAPIAAAPAALPKEAQRELMPSRWLNRAWPHSDRVNAAIAGVMMQLVSACNVSAPQMTGRAVLAANRAALAARTSRAAAVTLRLVYTESTSIPPGNWPSNAMP